MRNFIQLVEGLFDEPEHHAAGSFGWWVYPDGSIEEMEEAGNHGMTADGWLSWLPDYADNDDYNEAIAIVLERGGICVSTFHGSDTMHIDAKSSTIAAQSRGWPRTKTGSPARASGGYGLNTDGQPHSAMISQETESLIVYTGEPDQVLSLDICDSA